MIGMTVCSGIGAPEVSAPWVDWRWQSEIEAFPSVVLAHRFPDAVNLGDMTRFQEWPYADINVLCGGTPCQSFSVAGLRKGLDDPRGNLMLTYLAIARRYRPRWLVWENVPGVLSSNKGRDFGAFLRGLGELGYGFAYRVLDAQHVRARGYGRAVPQRRRRVFVVGHLADWRRAAAVLFDGPSLRGDPAPRREAGKAAPTIPSRSSAGGGLGTDFDCDGGLIASTGDVAHCLNAGGMGRQDYETETMIAQPVAIQERAVCENPNAGPDGAGWRQDGASYTLEARTVSQAVAFAQNQRGELRESVISTQLTTGGGKPGEGYPAVRQGYAVRRLTPTECERLQGFPDGWTDIPWRNKPHAPDGPRYKALGNSWAVNCGRWLFDRIKEVDAI